MENKVPDGGSVTIYHSWETMLQEGSFDIVYISTPHPLHYEETLKALSCKRHILVEKPATMNAAQYRKCISLAAEQEVVLMEAMWTRYLPSYQTLEGRLVASDRGGQTGVLRLLIPHRQSRSRERV